MSEQEAPEILRPEYYFDMEQWGKHKPLWDGVNFVWEVLPRIESYIRDSLEKCVEGLTERNYKEGVSPSAALSGEVYVSYDARIESFVKIDGKKGPVYIGPRTTIDSGAVIYGPAILDGCELRPGAFVRGNALVLKGAVVGNSTEVKNAIIGKYAEVPHYSYVGDSVLGNAIELKNGEKRVTHIGASGITSNIKVMRDNVVVRVPKAEVLEQMGASDLEQYAGQTYDTGFIKVGTFLGDGTDAGSQVVLGPGALIGRECLIYPGAIINNIFIPQRTVYKVRQQVDFAPREDR